MTNKPIVALIYDFDGTLSPGNMQEFGLIQDLGLTPDEFWEKSNEIAQEHDCSDILAYMKLLLDKANEKGISLTRSQLRAYGSNVVLYNGVKEWFGLINEYGNSRGVSVEHYINSSGLKAMIEGTAIAKEFKHIFSGSFIYSPEGKATWPGVAVDYTGKTQFLFKINKGIFSVRDTKIVNSSVAEDLKRIPFTRMIYIGDGDTDIPCMKIVNMFGGHSIAVYNPLNDDKKAVAMKIRRQGRVNFIAPAEYSQEGRAYQLVCAIIDKIAADAALRACVNG